MPCHFYPTTFFIASQLPVFHPFGTRVSYRAQLLGLAFCRVGTALRPGPDATVPGQLVTGRHGTAAVGRRRAGQRRYAWHAARLLGSAFRTLAYCGTLRSRTAPAGAEQPP